MIQRMIAALAIAAAQIAYAAPASYPLDIVDGHLTGPGAEVLHSQIQRAQFILYGEDHGFADSPIVLRAIARDARPLGFQNLVVEVGPVETQIVAATLARKGMPGLSDLVTDNPIAVPFLSLKEDAELAGDFVSHDAPYGSHLWGIDQAFVGAPALLLDRLVTIAPDAQARATAEHLLATEREAVGKMDQARFFLFSTGEADFTALAAQFKHSEEAGRIIDSLRQSAAIYQLYSSNKNYQSNAQRSQLLVSTFLADYRAAREPAAKAIFKMGADHLGVGMTPNNTLDPGTVASSIAIANGQTALRILFLPTGGSHVVFSPAPGNPFKVEAYADDDTKDFLAATGVATMPLAHAGWTLIPLEPIRESLGSDGIGKLKPMTRFFLLGYDYMITTPDAKPGTPLYHAGTP